MKKKLSDVKHGKRNFGIFFIILQCASIHGATLDGNSFPKSLGEWIGFLIFGIIGIILIILDITGSSDKKRGLKEKQNDNDNNIILQEESKKENINSNETENIVISNNDKYNIYFLEKKYKEMIDKIETDDTDEILETIVEIEELDKIYNNIFTINSNSIMGKNKFNNYKLTLLSKRIQKKFDKYMISKEKIELFKSFKDEIVYCKKRYPQYNKILNVELLKIENILNQS